MLDFDHRPSMFPATISLTDVTSSLCIDPMPTDAEDKYSAGHLFVRQPYSLQIIQLVEETAPPPRQVSDIDSSSMASSSYWSSEYSESACSEDDDEQEEEEEDEDCSSYCSSDLPPQEASDAPLDESMSSEKNPTSTDTYSVRMKRILAWREDFYAQAGASLSGSSLPSLKRKLEIEDDDDSASHSSKRSRSDSSSYSSSRSTSISSLGMHSCPACDAFFDSQQSLRQHGLDAKAKANSEAYACSAAVEYEFE